MSRCGLEEFPGQHFVDINFAYCADASRKTKVLKGVARGIVATLKTASELEEDWVDIWDELKKSNLVEDLLGVKPKISAELQEIAKAWERPPNFAVRIQIISAIVPCYQFFELNRFNKKT